MPVSGDKVAVVCNPTDVWFSRRSWEQMWLEVPQIKVKTSLGASFGILPLAGSTD